MKILLYGINFAPELTGIGKYTGEMASWLAERGHEVRVITAPPYYPDWKVGAGHRAWWYRAERQGTVRVLRCPLWVPAQPNGTKRVLHLLSFAATSLPALLMQVFWRPDVVWMAAPAFACTPGALLAAKLSGAPAWLHIQDFEIDVAFDLGLLRGKLVRRLITGLEHWLLKRFDVVSSISGRMLQRLAQKGVPASRIVSLPNWVDIEHIKPLRHTSAYRAQLGLQPGAVVALFSGTLGAKQGLHMLPEVAKILAQRVPNLVMVICGDGVMKEHLQTATAGMPNVKLLPLQPKNQVNELLGMANIHLLPQEAGVADLVMPSKLAAMLASGRPVVSTAGPGTEVASVVQRCGLVTAPGDVQAMATAIEQLARQPALAAELGVAARQFAIDHLSVDGVLLDFQRRIQKAGGVSFDEGTRPAELV